MSVDMERQSRDALIRELETAGADIRGNAVRCPWHEDQHASGSVWQDAARVWRYKCHVCDACGDVFDLRALNSGRDVGDELREVSGKAKPARPNNHGADGPNSKQVFKTLGDLRVAVSRGGEIESEHVYEDPATGKTELLVFRLGAPGGKQFRQCHPVPGGWSMTAGPKPWPIYNEANVEQADEVIIAEGEKASDALIALGLCATTSPCGAGKAAHADWRALAGKRVILWPDADEPGRRHMRDVAKILAKLDPKPQLSIIEPGDLDLGPKEDSHNFIEQCRVAGADPKQAVLDATQQAKPTGPVADYQRRLHRIETGELACLPLPWPQLARLTRLGAPGRLAVLAGRQGAAKSFFALELLRYWLDRGIAASAYLLEGDTGELIDRTLAQVSGIADVTDLDWQKANGGRMRELTAEYQAALDRVIAAVTVSAGLGLETLENMATWVENEAKSGRRAIFIDPVSAAVRRAQPWVSDPVFVRAVKRVAIEHECTVILVSHLVKGADEGTPDKVAGSAAYGRFSDCVLQLMRHGDKASMVGFDTGRMETTHNQTLYIEKARAPGTGFRLAYSLTPGLTFDEHGVIARKAK